MAVQVRAKWIVQHVADVANGVLRAQAPVWAPAEPIVQVVARVDAETVEGN